MIALSREDEMVAGEREDRNRIFGIPIGPLPQAGDGQEPHRVLGIPVEWFGSLDWGRLRSARHPVRAYRNRATQRGNGSDVRDDSGDAKPR